MSTHISRSAIALTAVASVAIALSGCAAAETAPEAEVSTQITDEPVTLKFVYFDDPPATQLMDAFTAKHPNVTFEPQHIPFGDYVTSIKLTLNSADAPDLAQYNASAMRPLIKGGLIRGLNEWSEAYGWDEKFPEASLSMLTADEQASTYGVGNLYAIPAGTKFVGLYYNADILAEAGVEAPQTIAELETALDAVTAAGYRGISVGGLETGIVHLWASLQNVYQDAADYQSWVFGQDGSTIDTAGAAEATDVLASWAAKGYIADGAAAVSDTDALAEFVSGRSAFVMSGNWAAKGISEGIGDAAGFVPAPAAAAGDPRIAAGGSLAYAIPAKSKNANVAAAFLDFMAEQTAAQIQVDAGLMPVGVGTDVTAEGLQGTLVEAYQQIVDGVGVVAFPDFATTGMFDVIKPGLQGILAGQMSTADYIASLQAEWDSTHA
ncbi:ABC transporter substrate-binding protein [Salinibacterium sp. ZJ70]|uniref:ABC transporter substrate-binding protein n=1 Tax=Salinibacterium sp. ZJ70 TaxID=2708084 RepID=UPI00141E70C4|nr:extracellular solute-binding protein [Salinibacterium sp. ZJ70]